MGMAIDHFRPKSAYPESCFDWNNYYWACSFCNSNAKRDEFPLDRLGGRLLIDPCDDSPHDHMALSPTTGRYVAMDDRGEESIRVFGLNREVCVKGRKNAWQALQGLIVRYADHEEERVDVLQALREFPFQGVRVYLHEVYGSDARDLFLSQSAIDAIGNFPELID